MSQTQSSLMRSEQFNFNRGVLSSKHALVGHQCFTIQAILMLQSNSQSKINECMDSNRTRLSLMTTKCVSFCWPISGSQVDPSGIGFHFIAQAEKEYFQILRKVKLPSANLRSKYINLLHWINLALLRMVLVCVGPFLYLGIH